MSNVSALMLLALQGPALGIGFLILGWMLATHRRERLRRGRLEPQPLLARSNCRPMRPTCWLAIRSAAPAEVQAALGVHRPKPCSWTEGLSGGYDFFIGPRVNGWVIVAGMGLPNPTDDVDATFLFLTALSKQLGHVQYFYASRLLHHHAWARLDDGCVTRAYAWAGETVWNQGTETLPEIEAEMKLFGYGDYSATILDVEHNFQKVPQLAARWSFDPAAVRLNPHQPAIGVAGESAFG
jgi:hypothetical protein